MLLSRANAQGVTVPRLLVEAALAQEGSSAQDRRELIDALLRTYRYLAAVSSNVNQLARATNATGVIEPEVRTTLARVQATAERVDGLLEELSR